MGYGNPLILPGLKQNGARFHTGNAVPGYLHDFFEDKVLLRKDFHGHHPHMTKFTDYLLRVVRYFRKISTQFRD
jgi:hypothetical protein